MNKPADTSKIPTEIISTTASLPGVRSPTVAVYDCWNKIGVNGDHSCRELEKFVHCRNCPVYSAAGTRLLDRELPANYRREWTELFSRKKSTAPPGNNSAVIFRIDAEWLALPTQVFQEVVEQRTIHSLPHRRQGIVLGLTNIRGELLVCVSIGRLLGLEREVNKEKWRTNYDRLLVVQWNDSRLVFPVEEVHGIHRYHPQELKEVPATLPRHKDEGRMKKETPASNSPSSILHSSLAHYTRGILTWPSPSQSFSQTNQGELRPSGGWRSKSVGCLDEELLFYTLNRSLT